MSDLEQAVSVVVSGSRHGHKVEALVTLNVGMDIRKQAIDQNRDERDQIVEHTLTSMRSDFEECLMHVEKRIREQLT